MHCFPNHYTTVAVDLDNITLLSFNTTTQQLAAQPGAPLVAPATVQMVTTFTSTVTHDDLTVASTVDTFLSALEQMCALLPLILKRLMPSCPPNHLQLALGLPQPSQLLLPPHACPTMLWV